MTYLVGTAASSASSLVGAALASIPSPSANSIDIGPFSLNFYGLCIGIGVLAGIYLAQKRWADRGGDPDDIYEVAKWAVPAGLIGARAYHIITDWRPLSEWHKVWEGGLGIPGGLVLGILAGVWAARRRNMELPQAFDALIPGIPLAQAIGRVGNWFNQEIFGGPTDLPWAVEIDERFRPAEFADEPTFHPAFLYEALWNLLLVWVLIRIDRRGVLRKGMILPLYVLGYGIGRFLVEAVRIDAATLILGIRVNHWVSGSAVVLSLLALWFLYRKAEPSFYAEGGEGVDRSTKPDRGLTKPRRSEADADADSSADTKVKTKAKADTKVKTKAKAETKVKTKAKAETKSKTKAKAETKSKTKATAKTKTKAASKTETGADDAETKG